MTPNQKEAYDHMQKALEKLLPMARKHGTLFGSINPWTEACDIGDTAITAVKKVQNEQAQSVEPVARVESIMANGRPFISRLPGARLNEGDSLYLHPPQPQATTPVSTCGLDTDTLRDMAGAAFEEAMAFGISTDSFERLARHVNKAATEAAQGEKP